MIGALTIAILMLVQLVSLAVSCAALWVACQAMLTEGPSVKTMLKCCLQLTVLSISATLLLVCALRIGGGVIYLGLLVPPLLFAAIVRMFKKRLVIGWATAVGVSILYLMLNTGAGLGLAFITRSVAVQGFVCSSQAMSPTLGEGDRFLALKWRSLERWRIVVYRTSPTMANVSRVVGLPGERVEITSSGLVINGSPIPQPRGLQPPLPGMIGSHGLQGSPALLAANEYFIVSDNSERSLDSRSFGTRWSTLTIAGASHPWGVPEDQIIGIVGVRYWPLSRFKLLD